MRNVSRWKTTFFLNDNMSLLYSFKLNAGLRVCLLGAGEAVSEYAVLQPVSTRSSYDSSLTFELALLLPYIVTQSLA